MNNPKSSSTLRLCLALLLAFTSSAYAKTIPDTDKVLQVSNHFMGQVTAGDTKSALSLISAYLGIDASHFEQRSNTLIDNMKRVETSYGKALSFAKLDEQNVGDHFFKIRYLLKFQQAALIWEMNYYQPQSGWHLVDVSMSTDINKLFEK